MRSGQKREYRSMLPLGKASRLGAFTIWRGQAEGAALARKTEGQACLARTCSQTEIVGLALWVQTGGGASACSSLSTHRFHRPSPIHQLTRYPPSLSTWIFIHLAFKSQRSGPKHSRGGAGQAGSRESPGQFHYPLRTKGEPWVWCQAPLVLNPDHH